MKQFDVVIVGGGMVGQAFALDMVQKTQATVAIIEPNTPSLNLSAHFHTRVSAITPRSEKFLQNVGVWDLIQRKYAFTQTRVWDQNSHGVLDFCAADENLAHLGHIIENEAIQAALFSVLADTNVTFINAKLDTIEKMEDGYQLQLDNQQRLSCGLLIGADGARSRVRALAHIECSETDYQQKAIICTVQTETSFDKTTWQRFLSDSIIAVLPLSNNQASIVWSAQNLLADELLTLTPAQFAHRLSAGVEYRFGAFELLSEIRAFPLIERSAKDYVQENIALIGDAAHNIHPLAGQGVNLGFADAKTLANRLSDSSKKIGDYGVLRSYARARRLDNERMAKTMTGLDWIYKENNEPLRWLRGFGMNMVNDNPSLKSFLQQYALGNS